jgi:hypothetical protein
MESFEIFQKLANGARLWVRSAGSLQEAKTCLLELQRTDPAAYYVCDLNKRTVLIASTRERPELHTVADDAEFFGQPELCHRELHDSTRTSRFATVAAGGSPVDRWSRW